MVRSYLLLLFLLLLTFIPLDSFAQDFITTWKTDNPGTSNDNQVTIPTTGTGYDYTITWGDGFTDNNVSGNITHTYATPGTYIVTISGAFPRIFFNGGGDREKILTVEQWGSIAWTSMASAFHGCSNLTIPAPDSPDLSAVTDMSSMFRRASILNNNIDGWNVSTVTDMNRMFQDAVLFNQPLNSWDVSNVTNMSNMFFFATVFNQDLNNWTVDNVTNMSSLFGAAKAFNGDVSTWHVDNVVNMSSMFSVAEAFNRDISGWQITSATNLSGMFNGATAFNQDISTKIGGGNNGGDAWDTNGVLNMAAMFSNANAFIQPITNWDVSTVTSMRGMFSGHTTFNQNISTWVVDNVTELDDMFAGASSFNRPIGGWNVTNVYDMSGMFNGATSFNQNITGWAVGGVNDMRLMFDGASSFDQDLGGWDIGSLSLAVNMFRNSGLSVSNYDKLLNGWATQIGSINTSVSFGAQGIFYCAGESARAALIGLGWSITDAGQSCLKLFDGNDITWPQIVNGQPQSIDFGSTSASVNKSRIFTIENPTTTTMNNVVVAISGTAFTTTLPPSIINPGATLNFDINLNSAVVLPSFIETVTITSDDFTGSFQYTITGEVTLTPEPEISIFEGTGVLGNPILSGISSYFIGQDVRGFDVTNQFTITNIGSADLDISGMSIAGTDFSLGTAAPLNIPVNNSVTIDVTLSGVVAGDFFEIVTITSNDTDETNFGFEVSGQILGPEIWVIDGTDIFGDPEILNGQVTAVDFGSGTLGTDIVRQLTITDASQINLAISDISISGTAFTFSTPTPPLGIAGENDAIYDEVLFEITLSGATSGTFNETVTITSDDDTDPIFVFPITGTISGGACSILPTVDAGSDISICSGNDVQLAGSFGGSATMAIWSSSGTGSFDDNGILDAIYTLSATDITNGSVVLTLTVPAAGSCPQVQDQVTINIASTPVAGSPAIQGIVNEVTIVDVISASIIATGDVITVTLQQAPSKGSAVINSDNTISYTPASGTIGADSFDYEICNQCSLCSTGTISVDIANAAPVFTAPSTLPEVAPGQSIVLSVPALVSDLNNNIDLNSFSNFSSTVNASFTYDPTTGDLTLDYANAVFSSTQDNISFTICDQLSACTDVTLQVNLNGEITVFNGVSPNEDGSNDFFNIENIQFIEPLNKVTIYNRWGDVVFEISDYNNTDRSFKGQSERGKELPSGTYFYKIEFTSGRATKTGYLSLKK